MKLNNLICLIAKEEKKVRKADANVMLLKMEILEEDPNIVTGDPIHCQQCVAILSSTSMLEKEEQGDKFTWPWYLNFSCF